MTISPAHGKSVIICTAAEAIVEGYKILGHDAYVVIVTSTVNLQKTLEMRYKSDATKAMPEMFTEGVINIVISSWDVFQTTNIFWPSRNNGRSIFKIFMFDEVDFCVLNKLVSVLPVLESS